MGREPGTARRERRQAIARGGVPELTLGTMEGGIRRYHETVEEALRAAN